MKNLLTATLIIFVFSCEEADGTPECLDNASCISSEQLAENKLDSMKEVILTAAVIESCSESSECNFVGLGSKPCGGPWEYLIYSSNADVEMLLGLVENYNATEEQINAEFGRASDCSIALAPDSVFCENGCVAYREGVAFSEGTCCN